MQKFTRRLMLMTLGCEAVFLCIIGFAMSPTMAGNWIAFGWVGTFNVLCLLISFGMLWSELFAESLNEAIGEHPNPKLSLRAIRIECAKMVAHPVMFGVNLALMFLVQK